MSISTRGKAPASGLSLLEAMRPLQWVKNGLVFAAPLFAFAIQWEAVLKAVLAFFAFCMVASATYLINDLFDLAADRLHPVKRDRPLAAGRVSPAVARLAALLLMLGGVALSALLGGAMVAVVAGYLVLQALYNFWLKHVLIVDVMAVATGFVLRAVAGGVAVGVRLSPWFLFCVALLAFYVGLQKRKSELKRRESDGGATRKILRDYSLSYVEEIETAILACILMTYALWTIQAAETEWMMLSIPFVLYGVLRYQYLSHEGVVERPEEALFGDKPLLANMILWVVTCFVILAVNHLNHL